MKSKTTRQKILITNAKNLSTIEDKSINLIVTSPPYPMISMWDEIFYSLDEKITPELITKKPYVAFELMHHQLNQVYDEALKKLKDDGIVCINIGDATRTCNGQFALFPNGAKTIAYFQAKGFSLLPPIIWNKPTNSPNKFMGSGMLPVGAYNTLEFEHILIFRKTKRDFSKPTEKANRNASAFFWNERNLWCSNIWDFVGTSQTNKNTSRTRNGAFPLELPYRIIAMWSVVGDTVLDIFAGTGTTLLAAAALKRNGIAVELIPEFKNEMIDRLIEAKANLNQKNLKRIEIYREFLNQWQIKKAKEVKYHNEILNLPVMTKQEILIQIPIIKDLKEKEEEEIIVEYE